MTARCVSREATGTMKATLHRALWGNLECGSSQTWRNHEVVRPPEHSGCGGAQHDLVGRALAHQLVGVANRAAIRATQPETDATQIDARAHLHVEPLHLRADRARERQRGVWVCKDRETTVAKKMEELAGDSSELLGEDFGEAAEEQVGIGFVQGVDAAERVERIEHRDCSQRRQAGVEGGERGKRGSRPGAVQLVHLGPAREVANAVRPEVPPTEIARAGCGELHHRPGRHHLATVGSVA